VRRPRLLLIATIAVATVALTACGSGNTSTNRSSGSPTVRVVAAENFWGNIAAQLGGAHVKVTSIISDPSVDPHLYESSAKDASTLAGADLVIINGLGYDDSIDKLLSGTSKQGRATLTVADVLHVSGADANPHLWYDVPRVPEVAQAIVAQLAVADPADQAVFAANLATFNAALQPVRAVIDEINTKYPHAPVAYTERVPEYLLAAAGLDIRTPPGFASAIEEGNEPSARDTQAMNDLITGHGVKVLLYNSQATSPVTESVRELARRNSIPIVGVTETLPKDEPDYQSWQLHQVQALLSALGG
jgi:zinc/manganese transport system substrate-binding protein